MKTTTRTVVTRTGAFLTACVCAGALAACNHAAAAPPVVSPPLEMPPPPPRDVEPLETADTEAPAPVLMPEEPAHRPPTSRVRQTRPETPKPEAAKPEAKPEPAKPAEATPPVEAPKPPDEPPKPVTLQAQPATNEAEEERSILGMLSKADNDLRRVNYQTLNVDARAQYDYAHRYIHQAEDALTTRNLVFAKSVAQKAADIAAQLAGK